MSVSLNPEHADAGGFLNGVVVTLLSSRWVVWDYNGTQKDTVALQVSMEDENGGETTQYFSAGDPTHRIPSDDGCFLESQRENIKGLPQNSKALKWIKSISDAGYPSSKLDSGDVSTFDGLVVMVVQVPSKNLDGSVRTRTYTDKATGDLRTVDATDTVVSEIIEMPATSKGQPAKKTTSGSKPKAAQSKVKEAVEEVVEDAGPNDEGDTIEDAALAVMLEVLNEVPKIKKAQVAVAAFKKLKTTGEYDNTTVQKVSKKCMTDSFLNAKAKEGFWSYESGEISAAQ